MPKKPQEINVKKMGGPYNREELQNWPNDSLSLSVCCACNYHLFLALHSVQKF